MWEQLRAKHLDGYKFVRQHPIGSYYAGFACRTERLVIEVDGATHSTDSERAYDLARTIFFKAQGYRVLRVQNEEVPTDALFEPRSPQLKLRELIDVCATK